ncbi:MAG: hypothetical protein JXR07_04880 [Reichenbachiella sp.]
MAVPSSKPREFKEFDALDTSLQERVKLFYPEGFEQNLIRFTNPKGKYVSVLPFETEDKYYLIRMSMEEALEIIEEDDDYNEEGELRDYVMEEYQEKYDVYEDDED